MIEKGDKLYCHTSISKGVKHAWKPITKGKIYEVIDIENDDTITIYNDEDEMHIFSLYESEDSYYKNWLDIREIKLRILLDD